MARPGGTRADGLFQPIKQIPELIEVPGFPVQVISLTQRVADAGVHGGGNRFHEPTWRMQRHCVTVEPCLFHAVST